MSRPSGAAWAEYDLGGAVEGLSLGAGLRYVGKTWADNANTREVDAYTLADLALRYSWNDFTAALNVTNLFDKDYFATCSAIGGGCIRGEGREITFTLAHAF